MSNPIRFVIDVSGEHPVVTPKTTDQGRRETFECPRHGVIGRRIIMLDVTDGETTDTTGLICVKCLGNMLSCCRATKVKEEVLDEDSGKRDHDDR
jgi:hypothetical protein